MKVRVVKAEDCRYISKGEVYEVIKETTNQYYVMNRDPYYISLQMPHGYDKWRFVIIPDDLPTGWKYCQCGTITSKDKCCECSGLDIATIHSYS